MSGGGFWSRDESNDQPGSSQDDGFLSAQGENGDSSSATREAATQTIGRRAGSLSDELDFPEFVASLIHGTWDAMVDSSIRQMEAFSDLVSAISKPLEQFRDENISVNQAKDWLVSQHPGDLELAQDDGGYAVLPRGSDDTFGDELSPDWLAEFDLAGESLNSELIDGQLVPRARDRMALDRMQTLATLVMLGLNRIKVDDGSITARMRLRAAAADHSGVDYAVSDDPAGSSSGSWATRGSTTYQASTTKVSTVGVNAQTDSSLVADLFGQVKINFSSETLPLDRFVDDAQQTLLERAARPALTQAARQIASQPQQANTQIAPTQQPAAVAPAAQVPQAVQPQPSAQPVQQPQPQPTVPQSATPQPGAIAPVQVTPPPGATG